MTPNQYEINFMKLLLKVEKYCSGNLELNLDEYGNWWARDYIKSLGGSFIVKEFCMKPLIAEKRAKRMNINVRQCCDECDVYHVE